MIERAFWEGKARILMGFNEVFSLVVCAVGEWESSIFTMENHAEEFFTRYIIWKNCANNFLGCEFLSSFFWAVFLGNSSILD